jgi:hypothetical protein
VAVVRTCVPPELEVVSMPVGLAVTVMEVVCCSRKSWISTLAGVLAVTVTSLVAGAKPAALTVSWYLPTTTPTNRYCPRSLETSLPETGFLRVTRAFGQRVRM